MIVDRRIWKTGAMAVAATIAFAVFAFRAVERNSSLDAGAAGDCVATAQNGNEPGAGCTTNAIAQVAIGSFDDNATRYSTTIEIVNPHPTAISVSGNFYEQDGSKAGITLSARLGEAMPSTISGGLLGPTIVPGHEVLVISGGTTADTTPESGVVGWARIVSSGTVSIATFFELRDGPTNVLTSRVGVPAGPANMSSFVIPRIVDGAAGLDTAFALVNTGATSATIAATLKDAAGATLSTRTLTMAAGSHQASFTAEFFSLAGEPGGRNYHYIVFDAGTAAQFAAIALAFEGAAQTSFPVDVLR